MIGAVYFMLGCIGVAFWFAVFLWPFVALKTFGAILVAEAITAFLVAHVARWIDRRRRRDFPKATVYRDN